MPKIILRNIKGRHGKDGIQGKNGDNGAKGDKGSAGASGIKGEAGRAGLRGSDGKDGVKGQQGLRGLDGLSGALGVQGIQGEKGDPPAHKWVGESIQFQNPDGSWGKLVNLRGEHGNNAQSRVSGGGGASADDVVDLLLIQGLVESSVAEAKRVDFDGTTLIYTGWAEAGSAEGSLVWRIKRTTLAADGDVTDEFADGDTLYDNSWTDRVSLTYS